MHKVQVRRAHSGHFFKKHLLLHHFPRKWPLWGSAAQGLALKDGVSCKQTAAGSLRQRGPCCSAAAAWPTCAAASTSWRWPSSRRAGGPRRCWAEGEGSGSRPGCPSVSVAEVAAAALRPRFRSEFRLRGWNVSSCASWGGRTARRRARKTDTGISSRLQWKRSSWKHQGSSGKTLDRDSKGCEFTSL